MKQHPSYSLFGRILEAEKFLQNFLSCTTLLKKIKKKCVKEKIERELEKESSLERTCKTKDLSQICWIQLDSSANY